MLLALAVRWPYHLQVPQFSDEVIEALHAWRIAQGGYWPITHHISYLGVVYPYLLAALFVLFGPHPVLPRLMVMAAGVITTGVLYATGRTMGSRAVGALAALLWVTSSVPVLLNSHLAYSNSLAPLFVGLALWATVAAWRHRRGLLLVAAGFLWGLALQTHPTVVPLLPGVALAFAVTARGGGRRLLLSRWSVIGCLAFLVGYGNILWFNAQSGMGTLQSFQSDPEYFGSLATPAIYLMRLRDLAAMLGLMVLGWPNLDLASSAHTGLGLLVALAIASIAALLWRSRHAFQAVVVVGACLAMPMFIGKYTFPSGSRYLSSLLVPLYLLMAAAAVVLWRGTVPRGLPIAARRGALVGIGLILLLAPLAWLARFYADAERHARTNAEILALVDRAADRPIGRPVLVDTTLEWRKAEGGGRLDHVLAYLLTMRGVPFELREPYELARLVEHGDRPATILFEGSYEALRSCDPDQAAAFGFTPAVTARFYKFDEPSWSLGLIEPPP